MNLRLLLFLLLALPPFARAELNIPAFTAYLDPDPNGARIDANGLTGWSNPRETLSWFGEFKTAGGLAAVVTLSLSKGARSKLLLTVGEQSREAQVVGTGNPAAVSFGAFTIAQPGYVRFLLTALNPAGEPAGDVQSLVLDGSAASGAHFNLLPRRNSASVHLHYPLPKEARIAAFYCEATAVEDPVATYYMACGWHRGYFGMQVNGPAERRIIFSVWDSGKEGVDRAKVGDSDRTKLVAKGDGVQAGDFGHEGTGGHSHLVYPWKTGAAQRFVVTAQPADATHTVYSGYWFHPEKKHWVLISSWNAPQDGAWLHGLYSFSENFSGANSHLRRKVLFGHQWLRTDDGHWIEQTTASFSHDATGKADRFDRFMGVEQNAFFLSHGGFIPGFTKFGETFSRPSSGQPPADLDLSNLPP